jgi:hypothetical protein
VYDVVERRVCSLKCGRSNIQYVAGILPRSCRSNNDNTLHRPPREVRHRSDQIIESLPYREAGKILHTHSVPIWVSPEAERAVPRVLETDRNANRMADLGDESPQVAPPKQERIRDTNLRS